MIDITNKELAKELFDWAKYHRFSLAQAAKLIGRTRAWASLMKKALDNGEKIGMSQDTRDRIIELLDLK